MTNGFFAQAPQKMSYQCVVRNANGVLVTNQSVGIRISILQGSSTGTVVYQETYSPAPQTNANGLVSIEIGGGVPVTGTFSSIDWSTGSYFLKTETDPTGGTNYTIVGTSQLLSVPYALYAQTAGSSGDAVKITGDQTIAGHKTFNGITTVTTPINAMDAANKTYIDEQIELLQKKLLTQAAGGTVTDIDGNIYNTVKIGNQVWMVENLKTTKFNDGIQLELVDDTVLNTNLFHYCWYMNDEATYKNFYGALYNSYVVSNGKICPVGWHVPSDTDWNILAEYLGGRSVAGGKMKEPGNIHWRIPNTGSTNESGFTALPAPYRPKTGFFPSAGQVDIAYWWSATDKQTWYTTSFSTDLHTWKGSFGYEYSIRCLKD
jgi:uncharacterized protein (TIGR02145 family)